MRWEADLAITSEQPYVFTFSRKWQSQRCISVLMRTADGLRPQSDATVRRGLLCSDRTEGPCLIIFAFCSWNSGCGCGQSIPVQVWLFSRQKTIFSSSLREQGTERTWRSCCILSEAKQTLLAAFYPHLWQQWGRAYFLLYYGTKWWRISFKFQMLKPTVSRGGQWEVKAAKSPKPHSLQKPINTTN